MNADRLRRSVMEHEGFRAKMYEDTVGKLTIGFGRNIEDNGISLPEAEFMLANDLAKAAADTEHLVPAFNKLSDLRQEVLVEMFFNMGATRMLGFREMLKAIEAGAFEVAADEMLNSKWSGQVGQRAKTLAEKMRAG